MNETTQHVGGQSVSEKSQTTRTSKNLFEKSNSKTQYFVREVKGRRMTKNGVEFLIGQRNTRNEKNDETQRDRNTAADMDETRADGDDDDEGGNSEDEDGEHEDGSGGGGGGTVSHSKRRQDHSFYFTTVTVKRIEFEEDGILTQTL